MCRRPLPPNRAFNAFRRARADYPDHEVDHRADQYDADREAQQHEEQADQRPQQPEEVKVEFLTRTLAAA